MLVCISAGLGFEAAAGAFFYYVLFRLLGGGVPAAMPDAKCNVVMLDLFAAQLLRRQMQGPCLPGSLSSRNMCVALVCIYTSLAQEALMPLTMIRQRDCFQTSVHELSIVHFHAAH